MTPLAQLLCLLGGMVFPTCDAARYRKPQNAIRKDSKLRHLAPGAKRVLLVGNTGLLGENLERAICDRGNDITVLARRQVPTQPCSTLVVLTDRTNSTQMSAALEGSGPFDVVVDVSAFNPQSVSILFSALSSGSDKPFGGFYILVSSISACTEFVASGVLLQEDDCDTGTIAQNLNWIEKHEPSELVSRARRGSSYGVRKLAMERQILKVMPRDRVIILEPSYIVGAGDDRAKLLPYWIMRMSTGEPVLVPFDSGDTIQFTDAQSTAIWIANALDSLERLADISDVPRYFVAGPKYTVSQILTEIEIMLREEGAPTMRTVTWSAPSPDSSKPRMPLLQWAEGEVDITRATKAGLQNRPLRAIVREVYHQWASQDPPPGKDGWLSGEFWRAQTPNADALKKAMTRSEEREFMHVSRQKM